MVLDAWLADGKVALLLTGELLMLTLMIAICARQLCRRAHAIRSAIKASDQATNASLMHKCECEHPWQPGDSSNSRGASIIVDELRSQLNNAEEHAARCKQELCAALKQGINKRSICELKSLASPPRGVDDVLAAVSFLLMPPDVDPLLLDTSWGAGKKLLANWSLLVSLLSCDRDISPAQRAAVDEYTCLPHFSPDQMKYKSAAAAGLCAWVLAVCAHQDAMDDVRSTRAALEAATGHVEPNLGQNDDMSAQAMHQLDRYSMADVDIDNMLAEASQALDCIGKGDFSEIKARAAQLREGC